MFVQAPVKSRPSFPLGLATAVPRSMRWSREGDGVGMEVAGLISKSLDSADSSAGLAVQDKVRTHLECSAWEQRMATED